MHMTPAAIKKVHSLPNGMRIDLRPGGCCGTYYHFEGGPAKAGDHSITLDGAILHLSPEAAAMLQGARIDWGGNLKPPRFRVLRNPNTPHKCPCGRAFGRPWPGTCQPDCKAYATQWFHSATE